MTNEHLYKKIYLKIRQAEKILLVTHEKPDVDALSSVCAMIELLEKEEKKYVPFCADKPPHQFGFLPHVEKFKTKANLQFDDFDLIIVFDCGSINRTKLTDELNHRRPNQCVIEIDHHIKTEDYADLECRDASSASTAELIYDFFTANKLRINKNIANCILAGILTDSGHFIYSSTSDKTVKISSEMLSRGANMPKISFNTWRNKSVSSLKIWGLAMSRLQINKKYNLAYTILTLDEINSVDEEELEGISNFLGNLHEVKGVMILREQKDGTIKGSLRSSHPEANMAALAQALGGGGHIKAAGFTIKGKIVETKDGWKII